MVQNIVEYLRQCTVEDLFTKDSFEKSFKCWSAQIKKLAPAHTTRERLDLGDHLHEIFNQTAPPEGEEKRSQSSVSKGGKNWEALVCWYLNICTVGRDTVVVPPIKGLLPQPILDAVTIQIGAFSFSQEPIWLLFLSRISRSIRLIKKRFALTILMVSAF